MITSDSIILRWIDGYEIRFSKKVIQRLLPHEPCWSKEESALISVQIDQLLKKGVVERCKPVKGQFIFKKFLIEKPDGSHRLILN